MKSLKMRFFALFGGLGVFTAVGIGLVMYIQYDNHIEYTYQDILKRVAVMILKQYPVLTDPQYIDTKAEEESGEYWNLVDDMQDIAESFDMSFIYLLHKVDDEYLFIFSSFVHTLDMLREVRLYNPQDVPPEFDELYKTKEFQLGKPKTSIWGTYVSGYMPIIKDNTVVAFLGLDHEVSYIQKLRRQSLYALLLSLVVVLTLAGILAFMVASYFIKPIAEVEKVADALAKMDLNVDIKTLRADEIGNMQRSFIKIRDGLRMGSIDALTKLQNRAVFYQNVNTFMYEKRSPQEELHAFMVMDLDYFKQINDTYGHAAGDEVLRQVALVLETLFRKTDDVARMGGDEFTIFCKNIASEEMVNQKLLQLQEALAKIKPDPEAAAPVTASVGIVMVSQSPVDYETLFKNADEVLYEVKSRGRNGYLIRHI